MPTYKIYDVTSYGQLSLPPRVINCRNDSDAIFAAYQFHRGADQEIWQDKRRVSVVNANELIRMSAMASDMHETVVLTRELIHHSRECLRNADRALAPTRVASWLGFEGRCFLRQAGSLQLVPGLSHPLQLCPVLCVIHAPR